MDINEFVDRYVVLVDKPVSVNKKQGFLLSNGARIIFSDTRLTKESVNVLKRHYQRRRRER